GGGIFLTSCSNAADPDPAPGSGGGDEDGGYEIYIPDPDDDRDIPSGATVDKKTGAVTKDGILYAWDPAKAVGTVTVPDGIISIGKGAFENCTEMTSVFIPASAVVYSDYNPFAGCTKLTSITVDAANDKFTYSNDKTMLLNKTTSATTKLYAWPSAAGGITIPDYISEIGSGAFAGCSGLTKVTIPDSVTRFIGSAFENCADLKEISANGKWLLLNGSERKVFDSLSVSDITDDRMDAAFIRIPDGANFDGSGAIIDAEGTLIGWAESPNGKRTVPSAVKKIDSDVFLNCTGLTEIVIPASVTSINSGAFRGCLNLAVFTVDENNTKYSAAGGILYDKNKTQLIAYPSAAGNINLAEKMASSVTKIGNQAFRNCTELESITIPDSVNSIGTWVFTGCEKLATISINGKWLMGSTGKQIVPEIDKFQNENKQYEFTRIGSTSVTVENALLTIENGVLTKAAVYGTGAVTIPDSVTSIDEEAFLKCTGLKSIVIPGSVKTIGKNAFKQCTALAALTIDSGVQTIGNQAFVYCSALTDVTVPDSVTEIEWGAFSQCTALKRVRLSKNLKKHNTMFPGCVSLKTIEVDDSNELYIVKNAPEAAGGGAMLLAKEEEVERLYAWPSAKGNVEIPDYIEVIDSQAFRGCTELTGVTIHEKVRKISPQAFFECENLTDIQVPGNGTWGRFQSSQSWNSFSIGDFIDAGKIAAELKNTVKDSTFKYKYRRFTNEEYIIDNETGAVVTISGALLAWRPAPTKAITIPDGITRISNDAFRECIELPAVTIPEGVISISSSAFRDCTALTEVTIPASVKSISSNAFLNCSALKTITYLGTQEQWEKTSFAGLFSAKVHVEYKGNDADDDTENGENTSSGTTEV
ncbi:MAG: leucine-rich repeat domain-containing protein, partial [Treponema brennaborense]|nr:leucine-rich repeat domain-containing protein [Treponema brennaborense]